MSQKKLLFLGGGYADRSLIKASTELGFYTITCNSNLNDSGHEIADLSYCVDYSDINAVSLLVEKHNIDFIFPGCNDFAAVTASTVSEKYGLIGNDSTKNCLAIHHKNKFRNLLSEHGLPVPNIAILENSQDVTAKCAKLKFPVMVKPVDLTGGKGIVKASHKDELAEAIKAAFSITRQNTIVVEEYIDGSHHSVSCIIKDSTVIFSFAANEYFHKNPYLVAGAYACEDQACWHVKDALKQLTQLAIDFELQDGLIHAQYIAGDDNQTYLLDVCRRPPGDFFVDLVSEAKGVDYCKLIIGTSFNCLDSNEASMLSDTCDAKPVVRHCCMPDRNGVFNNLELSDTFLNALIINNVLIEPNHSIDYFEVQKTNIVLGQFCTFNELHETVKCINNHAIVRMKDDAIT